MADSENRNPSTNPEFTSLSDENAITEIDLGSFLLDADKESDAVLFEGFHEDIKSTEKSLEDELNSLYEDIMSTGPVTIVPKKMDDITSGTNQTGTGLDSIWMNPEEYMDVPKAAPAESMSEVTVESSAETSEAKDDIFRMIESLKNTSASETGFDDILSSIESNEGIALADTDLAKTGNLTEGFVPSAEMLEDAPAPAPVAPQPEKGVFIPADRKEFVVTIPDEDTLPVDTLVRTEEKTVGVVPDMIIEDDGKVSRKEKKQAKLEAKAASGKKNKDSSGSDIIRKVVLAFSILVIVCSSAFLVYNYIVDPKKADSDAEEIANLLDTDNTDVIDASEEEGDYPEGMLAKYKELYDVNSDLKGWISIPGLSIDFPIVQGTDNDYYLHKNFYKKYTNYGVPFFDYRITDFENLPKNTVVYGHNMRYNDMIFGLLECYMEIDEYKNNPTIQCNTIYGDYTWKIYAVFLTNSEPEQDNGNVFAYNFIDLGTDDFTEYINEIDKRKLYDTGVDIRPSDKILTLSTCAYDYDGERLVVVARLVRDGESETVDTSKVVKNENPKYPQAWYDANKKTNPYA